MSTDAFGEVNRKFMNERGKAMFEEEWTQKMAQQLRDCLQTNVDWIGIRKLSDDGPPVKMMDYACGNGVVTRALFDSVDIIRGVDISDAMVEEYNRLVRESGASPERVHAVRGNFLDSSTSGAVSGSDFHDVDVIVMSMALHHISNPEELLSHLVQRLRSGGVMVIIDYIKTPSDDLSAWNHAHAHDDHATERSAPVRTVHKMGFSPDEMKKFFSDAGCKAGSFDFRPYKEPTHIPESVTKVKGGLDMTFSIARAWKL
ncbi:hypothetical protein M426DRAFT_325732 [Hypoxylon sp. CI-4A]|nr:hypothetical protein M426DRAFT_325732 [Hypoxylon sp. CI-4A]